MVMEGARECLQNSWCCSEGIQKGGLNGCHWFQGLRYQNYQLGADDNCWDNDTKGNYNKGEPTIMNTTKSKILEKLFVNYVNSNSDRIRALAKFCNLSQQEKSDLVVAFKKHQLTIKGESK